MLPPAQLAFLLGVVLIGSIASQPVTLSAACEVDVTNSGCPGEKLVKSSKIAIVNPYAYCYEVIFALAYSLGQISDNVEIYMQSVSKKAGVDALLLDFFKGEILEYGTEFPKVVEKAGQGYDAIFYADWYPQFEETYLKGLLDSGFDRPIVVLTHEPEFTIPKSLRDVYAADFIKYWSKPNLQLFAISPHVAEHVNQKLRMFSSVKLKCQWFAPVFPFQSGEVQKLSGIAVQGKLDRKRRDYDGVFKSVITHPELMKDPKFGLKLIGSVDKESPLSIPEEIKGFVKIYEGLQYKEFYTVMQQSLALLPAFGKDRYYKSAASSSIAASLIVGVPLITRTRTLEKYSYLTGEAIIPQHVGEDYSSGMARALEDGDTSSVNLARVEVLKLQAEMLKRTRKIFGEIVLEGVGKRS